MPKEKLSFRIKERSLIARLAAWKLNSDIAAIVIGNTIFLHNASRSEFLNNKRCLLHELKHLEQFSQHGFIRFIFMYLIESIRHGYTNNKFEIEARAAEKNEQLLTSINFVEKRKIKYFEQ
jgi:hypothetical protein